MWFSMLIKTEYPFHPVRLSGQGMHQDRQDTSGRTECACLPNGIVVKIVPTDGWKEGDPDIVIGSSGEQ